MIIRMEKEEQYILLVPETTTLEKNELEKLEDKFTAHLEDGPVNFILNLEKVQSVHENFYYLAEKMQQILSKEDGKLVIAEANDEIISKLNDFDLITTPTQDEAVDFIFMEEIEKQLRMDEDEPLWE